MTKEIKEIGHVRIYNNHSVERLDFELDDRLGYYKVAEEYIHPAIGESVIVHVEITRDRLGRGAKPKTLQQHYLEEACYEVHKVRCGGRYLAQLEATNFDELGEDMREEYKLWVKAVFKYLDLHGLTRQRLEE